MKVTVFGIGYVGLVQAAVLADVGHDVLCIDIDVSKVERLNQGHIPIYEPGLEALVRDNRAAGRLNFTADGVAAVKHGEVQFIAVGTPPDEDGSADLKYVLAVAETIGLHMDAALTIIDKSTVPVGTADKVSARIAAMLAQRDRSDLSFEVVSNPEFLKEGCAVADCTRPDRIVIGTASPQAEAVMRELYAPFNRNHDRIIVMDVRSAELTKYAANCLLATKISFMNEMANLAERLGADIEMVRQGIGSDPRIGYQFLYAGVGYGGSCFPKDVQALIQTADGIDFDATLLKAVERRNAEQKQTLFNKLSSRFNGELAGKTFALWGLSFKPNTDDMREAPSRVLMEALWRAGAKVQAYDPEAMEETQRIYGDRDDLRLCGTQEAALKGADALMIVTEWQAFKAPDFNVIKRQLKQPLIFDGRNLFDPGSVLKKGIEYISIGRPLNTV
ncbi:MULTISPECIES: UDP-glucose dehydrogenase family protein [Pseudomonas]|jgi:UDPglucose 6-dehydrogenase|uniref:UDP-glucose 6-dehydrogenase n=2 Tax=Gammaproteobacteria TaxID=1236 RepID=A0A7Y1F354_PSEVE|nr:MULTISPECIES: UDP-glucose/GDP-mannose dehydrogenase family protein [Pseudomonas]SEC25030.1 UDPglucose 6-dehydrogenase [Pseudomonas marginalis]KRP77546.1 UDP-glucose 6-dehydrogenase [Pseudomonas veronii]MBI6554743.1 UDP-glucose/GDP-mannose dehydrogenase family protein [Pseudomonas veronii]MBI6650820.1 UDP-glucose/GDP-mannose dehydrogenase family protein [Pseudomonas veronii]MCT8964504.1 UDP-glucose/GDP-mannose dehydrogenase family protein [Pseudomonas veronii]